jgi:hypothetical protein
MPPMSRLYTGSVYSLALAGLLLTACSSDPVATPPPTGTDAAAPASDSGMSTPVDAGVVQPDAAPVADAATPDRDAGMMTQADAAGGSDAAVQVMDELVPGSHVSITGRGRVALGDTYAATIAKLGAGRRTAGMGARSYEWTFGTAELTVWFTNTNLDNDDEAPNDVDGTDVVLWIAVSGGYTGRTPMGVGVGSTRMATETAYGASPRTTALTMPTPGQLLAYYTRGFLAAFGQDGLLRTFTVCKAYPQAPDGRIDIAQSRLTFGGTNITARLISGTDVDDVRRLLGPPDSEGPVPNQNDVNILNYAFIGLEVIETGGTVFTAIVHAPYYGETGNGTPGLGATRTDFEAYVLSTLSGSGPRASTRTMGLFCFTQASGRSFGVTYSTDMPQTVSAIILGPCQ